jgi:hypothetical protein
LSGEDCFLIRSIVPVRVDHFWLQQYQVIDLDANLGREGEKILELRRRHLHCLEHRRRDRSEMKRWIPSFRCGFGQSVLSWTPDSETETIRQGNNLEPALTLSHLAAAIIPASWLEPLGLVRS